MIINPVLSIAANAAKAKRKQEYKYMTYDERKKAGYIRKKTK